MFCLSLLETNGWVQPFTVEPHRLFQKDRGKTASTARGTVELNRLFQIDRGKTASMARILSPNPTRRPLPCLLIQSFFYWYMSRRLKIRLFLSKPFRIHLNFVEKLLEIFDFYPCLFNIFKGYAWNKICSLACLKGKNYEKLKKVLFSLPDQKLFCPFLEEEKNIFKQILIFMIVISCMRKVSANFQKNINF